MLRRRISGGKGARARRSALFRATSSASVLAHPSRDGCDGCAIQGGSGGGREGAHGRGAGRLPPALLPALTP
eukprot:1758962-Rhodomonas_salina.1